MNEYEKGYIKMALFESLVAWWMLVLFTATPAALIVFSICIVTNCDNPWTPSFTPEWFIPVVQTVYVLGIIGAILPLLVFASYIVEKIDERKIEREELEKLR